MAASDVDYRLLGLSPQYWSYTPLLIGDLVALPLINGVDCLVVAHEEDEGRAACDDDVVDLEADGCDVDDSDRPNNPMDADTEADENPKDRLAYRILPLSRVLLRGVATAIDRRPNGCTLIVLDDGTGSIDCRCWDDSQNGNSAYNLPALLPEHEPFDKQRGARFVVGDSLEVLGKIKTLTAGSASEECKLSDGASSLLEVRHGCVREIHANSVCLLGEGPTRMANQWNGEMVHWLKCMDFARRLSAKNDSTIRNGKDVLPLLGERISSSILDGGSADYTNSIGSENVLTRKCCQTSPRFRRSLFYCHCEATLEALDPAFGYRDALLNHLLDVEARLARPSDGTHPSATEDCMDLYGVASDASAPPLLFTFESINKDAELSSIAAGVVASTNLPEANAQRLVRKTFAAMVNDGILSLYDAGKDLYLLVTRTRVIEPFLRRSRGMGGGGFGAAVQMPQPFFIRSVPKKRIAEIVNWIESSASG